MLRVRVHSIQDREHNIFHMSGFIVLDLMLTQMLIFALFFRRDLVHFQNTVFYQVAIVRVLLSLVHINRKMASFNINKVSISRHFLDGKSSFVDYTCQLQLNFHI